MASRSWFRVCFGRTSLAPVGGRRKLRCRLVAEELEARTVLSPVVNAGAPATINEGGKFSGTGSFSDPGANSWTATVDYGDGSGSQSLGLNSDQTFSLDHWYSDSGLYTVTVQVSDDGGLVGTGTMQVTVNNVAPTPFMTTPLDGFQGVPGQDRLFYVDAWDSSQADQNAGFTYTVDWGDGSTQTLPATPGNGFNTPVDHVYVAASATPYTISMTATDQDGGTSAPYTQTVAIRPAEMQYDLAVGGTAGNDTFVFRPDANPGDVQVSVNGTQVGTYQPSGNVRIYDVDGSDTAVIYGTPHNDSFALFRDTAMLNGQAYLGPGIHDWKLFGQAGDDTFTIWQPTPATINGGHGSDTLRSFYWTNTWTLRGADRGDLNSLVQFTGVENISGTFSSNRVRVLPGSSLSGSFDGGASREILDYSAYGSPVLVDLQTQSAPAIGRIANLTGMVGSGHGDTLVGADIPNEWVITGSDAGSVNGFSFRAVANLTGGSGVDWFTFRDGASMSGQLDGAGGGDWLDYAPYTTPVTVNLSGDQATNVAGGIRNIQNVRGGQEGNTLTGDAQGNILIGGAGNDVLIGGSGRSILIGGKGSDTITGGSGDDIVIGGHTAYDGSFAAHNSALAALLAEWQRSDEDYLTRISHLHGDSAGGLNGSFVLRGSTVFGDGAPDMLTGGDGLDWFWGQRSEITDSQPGERIN